MAEKLKSACASARVSCGSTWTWFACQLTETRDYDPLATVPRRRVRQSVWCPCWYLCLVAASKRCGEMNVKPGVDYSASFSGLTLRSLRVCPVFLLCSRYREASSAGTSMCAQPLSCSTGQWCDQLAEIIAVWTAFTLTPTLGRWTVSAHSGWLVVVFVCCRIL